MALIKLLLLCILHSSGSADQSPSPYDFKVFENFEVNKGNFINDLKIYKSLKVLKDNLDELRTFFAKELELSKQRKLDHELPITATLILRATHAFTECANYETKYIKKANESIQNLDLEFATPDDLEGAYKGLVQLQGTYNLDASYLAKGCLKYKSIHECGPANVIQVGDLINMAYSAFYFKFFSSSVDFLRAAVKLANEKPDEKQRFGAILEKFRAELVKVHNEQLIKSRKMVGVDYKVHPYIIDENLKKAKKQPKGIKALDLINTRDEFSEEIGVRGYGKEDLMQRTCRSQLWGNFTHAPHCHFLHHHDPYLKLGPFKLEVMLHEPYRVVYHELLSEKEIDHMKTISIPNLSRKRYTSIGNSAGLKNEFRSGERKITVHKTVQYWFNDVKYPHPPNYTSDKAFGSFFDEVTYEVDNRLQEFNIIDQIMFKLSKKLQLATQLNLISTLSSSMYQTTNYGLGGLCETHNDPGGYVNHNVKLTHDNFFIRLKGDMLATIMGWLEDVKAGGGTAFMYPNREMLIEPRKGSVAFWMNLDSSGYLEKESTHGGCPVLMGSKWILNKWIYLFDQWKNFPCLLDKKAPVPAFEGIMK